MYKSNKNETKKILLIEICNFIDYPIGGYLSFAKQMLTAFGNQLVLVGLSTDNTPTGKWIKKEIDGITYDYFSVGKVKKTNKKTFIPIRLKSYFLVKRYQRQILSIGIENIFIQTPEVLFALNRSNLKNLCARIPGVENPMSISRYWYGKFFTKIFDHFYFRKINIAKIILASADNVSIHNFINRGKGVVPISRVIQFPTRVNTDIFRKTQKENERIELGLSLHDKIIVTTGRLSQLKGWKFMLDCFLKFKNIYPNSIFIFLGDGEDRLKIEEYIDKEKIGQNVKITGRISHQLLAKYLNAADLYIMGSYVEGWATSLVEAVSCAKPVVCSNFSSAKELIENGINGYVIENRNTEEFVRSMLDCFNIPEENLLIKSMEMQQYSVSDLKNSILKHWKLI
ncbi:MAG TPA: hypothetical protein DCR40_17245 [Prolixibacteraceae bacterium]|nr:hypothetical protein [Prolixibacteraceae bacterium]